MSDAVTLDITQHAAALTLNAPETRNAMSSSLLDGLHARLTDIEQQLASGTLDRHVLVLTGSGKAFCAGMDLKAVLADPTLIHTLLRLLAEASLRIRALPMVTIAHLNGPAIGGGCGLAMVCDLVASAPNVRIGFPEVDLGACPAVVAPWLVRKISAGNARRVLLTGGTMTAREGHALGMVSHLLDDGDGDEQTLESIVARLAGAGPTALAATKRLLNDIDGSLDREVAVRGAALSAEVFSGPEAQERIRARFAK